MRHSIRLADGKRQCGSAAERKADDGGPLDFKRVQNADEIARKKRRGITAGNGGCVGQTVAALIVSNDAEAVLQGPDLMKPHALAAGEAVQKHNWRPGAGIADVDG